MKGCYRNYGENVKIMVIFKREHEKNKKTGYFQPCVCIVSIEKNKVFFYLKVWVITITYIVTF